MLSKDRDAPAKRSTLTLQQPSSVSASPSRINYETPSTPRPAPPMPQSAPKPTSKGKGAPPITLKEWREFRRGASPTPITLNAVDVGWMIEGGDDNKGKTICGLRNGKEHAIMLDHRIDEVSGWFERFRKNSRRFKLGSSGRVLVLTPDVVAMSKPGEENPEWTIALLRGKGVSAIPIDISYGDFRHWLKPERAEPA